MERRRIAINGPRIIDFTGPLMHDACRRRPPFR
jgi:hypothetical protein